MNYLQTLVDAQTKKDKAKKATTGARELPPIDCEVEFKGGKMVITMDVFPEMIPSASGKSVLLTSFNKYATIKGLGLKARANINISVPAP